LCLGWGLQIPSAGSARMVGLPDGVKSLMITITVRQNTGV